LPFGFDPKTYRLTTGDSELAGLFVAPDGSHAVHLRRLVDSPDVPTNLLFEEPKTAEEGLSNARLYAHVAESHLSMLAMGSFGMKIPDHQTAIGWYPPAAPDSAKPALTIFRKMPRVGGVPLDRAETVTAETEVQQVIAPQLTYYEWLNTTDQPFFLRGSVAAQHTIAPSEEPFRVLDETTIVLNNLDRPVLPRTLGFSADLMYDIFGLAGRIDALASKLGSATLQGLEDRGADLIETTETALSQKASTS